MERRQASGGKLSSRVARLIEVVMLAPGGRDAARILITVRYALLLLNTVFLSLVALFWEFDLSRILMASGLTIFLIGWTLALRFVLRTGAARALRNTMIASFLFDFTVEVMGLMVSGLAHSIIAVMPLLTLMTVALLLDVRATLICAAYFMVVYPLGALLMRSGLWPSSTFSPSPLSHLGFVLVQELYFGAVLTAFLFLVVELRRLYRRLSRNLEAASARITAEVTERQIEKLLAEKAILQRERDYRLLADHVTDVVALCDAQLRYTFVSPSAAAVLGYPATELVGSGLRSVVHGDDWPSVERMLVGNRDTREFVVEHRARHKEERWIWMETRGRSVPEGGSVLSSRDITERRLLEEKMRQTQKLEGLGLLAGGIAHDFNNILLGIMGPAELAAMEQPAESPTRKSLLGIVAAANRAAGLCKQMLDYAGKGRIALSPLNLNELIEEIPALLKAALSQNATLCFDLDPNLPCIEGDAAQIQQVAMNLILNAAEALPDSGGTVTVASRVSSAADWPQFGAGHQLELSISRAVGKYVTLMVSDDGCGMAKGTLERIFDPFFSTKFAGRGLGLSAVAGIVNAHRGVIRVRSEPGKGTTVTAAFPLTETVVIRKTSRPPSEETAAKWCGKGTVLLVDDEPSILDIVSQMLSRLGFQVLTALGGAQALALFRQHAGEIVLVVCDFAMPEMDGLETFRALKDLRPELPFVMTSGLGEKAIEKRLGASGPSHFLQKPFSFRQLAKLVQSLKS